MIPLEFLPAKYMAFQTRWTERNDRMADIVDAVNGIWDVDDPSDDAIDNRSPNFIQVALEDTAEAASLVPSVRVKPSSSKVAAKEKAIAMERFAISYLDSSQIELLGIRSLLDLAAFGMFSWLVYDDPETGAPVIQWRDPRTCFPEPGWKTFDSTRTAFFARELYVNQLPEEWQAKIQARWPSEINRNNIERYMDRKVILIEYFEGGEWLIAALYQTSVAGWGGTTTYQPVELERGETPGGVCPVVVAQRITLDNEPRGQFDQVIGLMRAHIRLMGMVLDYADQAVYSDVWVKDLIGPLNVGGGAYIQLGPNGAIGRVPPAQSDITVFRELESLVDSMHLAARWPKTRPGEIDQAIASAKFVEATAGVMNTVIRTYHLVMKRALEQALRVCFLIDSTKSTTRTISGVLRNQQFLEERDTADIDLDAKVRIEYGLGLGHDPAQAMVLGIQAQQAGFVSSEFVQENFEGITDVALERARIDTEQLRSMALARLLSGLEDQSIPPKALVEIARARMNGDDIFELFNRYVVEPQEEQMASQLVPTMGEPTQPGGPLAPPPEQGVPVPGPEALLGGLGAPPEPPQGMARLNVPLGDGGFAGTTSQTG